MLDPTDADGRVASDSPFAMSLVNEPTGDQLPSISPLSYRYGLCRDRAGRYLAAPNKRVPPR